MTSQWHPDATALAEYQAGLTGGRRGWSQAARGARGELRRAVRR